MSDDGGRPLSDDAYRKIESECAKYPPDRRDAGLMAALRIAQGERRWLSREMIAHVAEVIGVPAIRAHEVATFYNMYDTKPVGRRKISICTNVPCALMGAASAAAALKEKLGIDFGQTTDDGRYTLVEGECFGACKECPVVIVDNVRMHSRVTAERVDEFLAGIDPDR